MTHKHRHATRSERPAVPLGSHLEALEPQGGAISLRPEEEAHVLQRTVWEVLGEMWVADTAVRIWASEIISGHLYTAGFVVRPA